MGIREIEVDQPMLEAAREGPVPVVERLIGPTRGEPGLPDEVTRPRLVRRSRSPGALPVVCRGIRPADETRGPGRARLHGIQLCPDPVVGLDGLSAVPVGRDVGRDVRRSGRGPADVRVGVGVGVGVGRTLGDRHRQRPSRLEQGLEAVDDPHPAVLDVRPGERAARQVAVGETQPGELRPQLGEQPFDPARRLGGHRVVVADMPGVDEAIRRLEDLDDPVDRWAPVGERGEEGLAGDGRLREGCRVEVGTGELRVDERLEHPLDRCLNVDLVDVRSGHVVASSSVSDRASSPTLRPTSAVVNGRA